jgi:hypothetical protein
LAGFRDEPWSILYLRERLWITVSCSTVDSGVGFDKLYVFHFTDDTIHRSVASSSSVAMSSVVDGVVVDVSLYFYITRDRR